MEQECIKFSNSYIDVMVTKSPYQLSNREAVEMAIKLLEEHL